MNQRPGNLQDATRIADIIASFAHELTDEPSGQAAEQYFASVSEQAEREYLKSDRYRYTIALDQNEIIGFIAIRDNTHIFHLFVRHDKHGQGVATSLWTSARRHAVASGNSGPFTVNSSLKAIPVYRKFGFFATGPVTTVHGISFQPMRTNEA
jgi:GNAT superfamily N-acetyltransferase